MEILHKLKEQGWYLTKEGLQKINDVDLPGIDIQKIIAAAMNWDLREIAGGALPEKREDTLPGRIVLQVVKIRNVAAPKANEESKAAPRLLQVDLTDGQNSIQALEVEPIPVLNLDIAPGTKVFLKSERLELMQGFAALRAGDVQILGGRVEHMAEKWEVAQTMLKYARGERFMSSSNGPPPWVAFGQRLQITDIIDVRNFKSFQAAAEKEKESRENEEFNAMRSVAIAEAARAGANKVFGGGNQQILDHNLKKILEKGYSYDDAAQALRSTNNNLERALFNLKRSDDNRVRYIEMTPPNFRGQRSFPIPKEFTGKRGETNSKEEEVDVANPAAKPATNVSLYDFLTDKLPSVVNEEAPSKVEVPAPVPTTNTTTYNNRFEKFKCCELTAPNKQQQNESASCPSLPKFENNISSSFTANRLSGEARNDGAGRHEREYQGERQISSRYSSGRPGSGRCGRGLYLNSNRGSYDGNGNRGFQRREIVSHERGGERNSNSKYNNNRGNRSSYERQNTTSSQSSNERNMGSSYNNQRTQEPYNKGYEKWRYYQREQCPNTYASGNTRRYDNNPNRHQSNHNSNNNNHNHNNNGNNTIPVATNANNINSNNSDHSGRMSKLLDLTSKMKIDKTRDSGRNQQRQPNQQYYQPPQQRPMSMNQKPGKCNQSLANGFSCDSSKIIGFQNKETNEFAMTVLKSQGRATAAAATTISPLPSSTASTPSPSAKPQETPLTTGAVSKPPLPPTLKEPPPSSVVESASVPSSEQRAPPPKAGPSTERGMQHSWHWKIGNLCFAKYWDDGKYYEAEITGLSDKTCVVFFRGYGNHEEVLQSDCVPITDSNHRTLNQHKNHPSRSSANTNSHSGSFTRGVPNRYRGERQMYVPPPKREN